MKEMQLYLRLQALLAQLWPGRTLTLAELGCLAMAAQAAADNDAALARLDSIERGVQRRSASLVCYQLITLAMEDFRLRVCAAELASPGDISLVDLTCRVKQEQARAGTLGDFLLTGQYRFFPPFFRQYDTLTHT
jgi:hypothetical protein